MQNQTALLPDTQIDALVRAARGLENHAVQVCVELGRRSSMENNLDQPQLSELPSEFLPA